MRRTSFIARRKAIGLSQQRLAETLGVERSTVVRWESGQRVPQPLLRARLAQALAVSVEDVAALFGEPLVPGPADPAVVNHLDQLEELRHSMQTSLSAGAISAPLLDELEEAVVRYGNAARDRVPAVFLADLSSELKLVRQLLSQARTASSMRRLSKVTAELSGLVSLTLIKMDDRPAFRRWARTARLATREAEDAATSSWVLAQESYGHYYATDYAEAVSVAQAAQREGEATYSAGPPLAAALEARAHAVLGGERQSLVALGRAEELLGCLPGEAVTSSAFGYNEGQLRFHEANALTRLHSDLRAESAQERALMLCSSHDYLDRTLIVLDAAERCLRRGDASGALGIANEALTKLSRPQRSGVINLRIREISQLLPTTTARESAASRQFDELLLACREDAS